MQCNMTVITYAVGDIHGRLDLLENLLDHVEADAAFQGAAATIVFTGDYVDRGASSYGVVERLIAGPRRAVDRFVCLRGNHDDLFIRAITLGTGLPDWAWQLHRHAILSYRRDGADHAADLRRHASFLAGLPLIHDDGRNLFVHAGIRPGVAIEAQTEEDLTWIRADFLDYEGPLPRRVIHGHTIMGDEPVVRLNRVSIDTGAYRSGRLTAAVIDGETLRFLQAIGEPDRAAIVREAMLAAGIAGQAVSSAMQTMFDDFLAGRIGIGELDRRTRLAA